MHYQATPMHYRRFIALIVGLLLFAPIAGATTQVLGGTATAGNLRISVTDEGSIGVEVYSGSAWIPQFASSDTGVPSKGSKLFADGAAYSLGYFTSGAAAASGVSNTTTADSIETVWSAGNLLITQTLTYTTGRDFYELRWDIKNNSSADASDLRFFHGGENSFASLGGANSTGAWRPAAQTVALTRIASGVMHRMSLQAVTSSFGYQASATPQLQGSVASNALTNFVDTASTPGKGTALEWRTSLPAGETWTIEAAEEFSNFVTVSSHTVAAQAVVRGYPADTATATLTLTNLTSAQITIYMSLTSTWNYRFVGSVPVRLAALSSIELPVQVMIATGAAANSTETQVALAIVNGVRFLEPFAVRVLNNPNAGPTQTPTPPPSATVDGTTTPTATPTATATDAGTQTPNSATATATPTRTNTPTPTHTPTFTTTVDPSATPVPTTGGSGGGPGEISTPTPTGGTAAPTSTSTPSYTPGDGQSGTGVTPSPTPLFPATPTLSSRIVAGQVLDMQGQPAGGVFLYLFKQQEGTQARAAKSAALTETGITSMRSDLSGKYQFTELEPGTYRIRPNMTGLSFAPASVVVAAGKHAPQLLANPAETGMASCRRKDYRNTIFSSDKRAEAVLRTALRKRTEYELLAKAKLKNSAQSKLAASLDKLVLQSRRAYTVLLMDSIMLPKLTFDCASRTYCLSASSRRQLVDYQRQMDKLHTLAVSISNAAGKKLGAASSKKAAALSKKLARLRTQAARLTKKLPGQTAICRE